MLLLSIIIILIILLIINSKFDYDTCNNSESKMENFQTGSTTVDLESIQNMASILNSGNLKATNMSLSGTLTLNSGAVTSTNTTIDAVGNTLNTKYNSTNINGDDLIVNSKNTNINSANTNVNGTLTVKNICFTDGTSKSCIGLQDAIAINNKYTKYSQMYYPDEAVQYGIFDAISRKIVSVVGSGSDLTLHSSTKWNGKNIAKFGSGNMADGNGAIITVPSGKTVLWLCVLGDRWNRIKAYHSDGTVFGQFTGGFRRLNTISPNGGGPQDYRDLFQWVPIPVKSGSVMIVSKGSSADLWLSDIAFSTNPWNHVMNSAVDIWWSTNDGSDTTINKAGMSWTYDNWNNDILAKFNNGNIITFNIPIINSGNDKLIYFVEHNNNWNSNLMTSISINNKPIEGLRSTYDNPFNRHYSSKIYQRYLAARIPKEYITSNIISVKIDMSRNNEGFYFREVGTHDIY